MGRTRASCTKTIVPPFRHPLRPSPGSGPRALDCRMACFAPVSARPHRCCFAAEPKWFPCIRRSRESQCILRQPQGCRHPNRHKAIPRQSAWAAAAFCCIQSSRTRTLRVDRPRGHFPRGIAAPLPLGTLEPPTEPLIISMHRWSPKGAYPVGAPHAPCRSCGSPFFPLQ